MMKDYEIILTSYEDCDYFVAEIWFQNELVAIVKDNQDIQLFNEGLKQSFFESEEFKSVLNEAKKKLNIR